MNISSTMEEQTNYVIQLRPSNVEIRPPLFFFLIFKTHSTKMNLLCAHLQELRQL